VAKIEDVDVVIVGAGISGIGAAYRLQTECPNKSYVVLEARETLGGTWDLFRYPGIRSDSDMHTLGFPFHPWNGEKSIADGPSILAYLRDTAETYGIDRNIRYRQRVERARWSTEDGRWTLDVRDGASGELVQLRCKFLYACAGYYDYEAGYTPDIAGRERFQGRIVHPQQWTDDVEYEGKRVVVIGSGATAVTLVPTLAKRAAHVTMLQRSPTYITSIPAKDPIVGLFRKWLPETTAHTAARWKSVFVTTAFYKFCRRFPDAATRMLVGQVRKAVHGKVDVDAHFRPRYKPWDQRLCLVPDGDLFDTLAEGQASVVTDEIETFTETGIVLRSGEELAADLIVMATGLRLKLLGGITLEVDGKPVAASETVFYKGIMLSDVPNLAVAIGYTNASWTLKVDLASMYVCRLLAHMDRHGYTICRPRRTGAASETEPLLDLSAGYVQRARELLPSQGSKAPWRLYQNYLLDLVFLRYGRVDDDVMEYSRGAPRQTVRPATSQPPLKNALRAIAPAQESSS
jgi:cation diffusion facilitator CzcD-associated flavoprotein CzcO